MSGGWESFLPGLAVLAVGIAAGVLLAVRLRRARPAPAGAPAAAAKGDAELADLELERADLIARRDEIYALLRAEGDEEVAEADRRELERSAARVLQRLDEIGDRMGSRGAAGRGARGTSAVPSPAAAAAPAGARSARPALLGFAFGAGFAALLGLLLYWAGRDATPRPAEPGPAAMGIPDDDAHSRLAQISPEARQRVEEILAHLARTPDDLDARKALTETYVMEGLFFEAFEQSERILELSPGDVDGLYFQGLIRLTMGQDATAIELLDRALENAPDFTSARLVRGLARLRSGDREAAMADWRSGLESAGGSHPGLERLIALAEAGASAEEILGAPAREPAGDPPAGVAAGGAAQPSGAPPPAAAPSGEGPAYRARLELAPGVSAPPGSVLFVNLRIVAGAGPPSAVKRIDAPRFPLELTLDANDAMPGLAGRPLPEAGVVSARLDADGNASTRDPAEPAAQAEARLGEPVTLVLR